MKQVWKLGEGWGSHGGVNKDNTLLVVVLSTDVSEEPASYISGLDMEADNSSAPSALSLLICIIKEITMCVK